MSACVSRKASHFPSARPQIRVNGMPKIDFKEAIVTASVASIGVALLLYGAYSIFRLPFLSWSGIAALFLLLGVTLVTSRFTVPVTHVDGASQTQKSVADTLIFLAVMMYTLAPTNNFGPPIIWLRSLRAWRRWT